MLYIVNSFFWLHVLNHVDKAWNRRTTADIEGARERKKLGRRTRDVRIIYLCTAVGKIFLQFHIFSIRQNRLRMQQEAQRDAPDPRESRPPCYSDAIRMPRLDGSFASLDELGSGRIKSKRRRRKTEEADDIEDEDVPLRRNRCRSEEIVSMRDAVTGSVRPPTIAPRLHPTGIDPIDINRSSNEAEQEELHYHSTDILTLDHSPGPSSRARSPLPQTPLEPTNESFEEIRNFDQSSNNTLDRSPYAKRKLGHMESFKGDKSMKIAPQVPPPPTDLSSTDSIEIYEDHFQASEKASLSSDSSDFITISAPKNQSSSSSNEDGLVVINRPTSF